MDPDQKKKITEFLPELIEATICSAKFLAIFRSKLIFSRSDVELIQTEERNKGPSAACSKFYDLLSSRSGSFDVLVDALKETNQTGALSVLNASLENDKRPRFISNPPKYITDYLNQQEKCYLIVCSDDCKLTYERILESTPNCKPYSIPQLLDLVSMSPGYLQKPQILLTNLDDNLDPIYTITPNSQLKVVLVTNCDELSELQDKLPHPKESWKITQDKIEWGDLSLQTQHEITTGLKQNLGIGGQQLINALVSIDTKILIDLLNEKFPFPENLFRDTIPPLISYYVPRSLQTRYVLSKKFFEHEFYDEFLLISGIERFVLSDMCQDQLIESSSNLLRKTKSTSQIIFLENEMDFDSISTNFPNHAVHLLKYECNDFVWKKSRGNLSTVQKYVASKQRTLLESEFVSEAMNHTTLSPICISDTPGKGKTVTLSRLAIEIKKQCKSGIVAFITIKELFQNLKANNPISPSTIVLAISRFLSKSTIGNVYLEANKHYLCHLMLDGFDEIDADESEFALKFISQIRQVFNKTRIWITSRPHMLSELERCLETLGYNITPFSRNDQIDFLSSFWSTKLQSFGQSVDQNLSFFADELLKSLKESLDPKTEDIAGIPLQCFLIGEAYEYDAKRFVESALSETPTFSQETVTVLDLYDKLLLKKFEIFQSRYSAYNFWPQDILNAHFRIALLTLFPARVFELSDLILHSMSMQQVFDFGLVGARSVLSTPTFLHRTFAEFFLACFLAEFIEKSPNDTFFDFLYTDIMMTDQAEISMMERVSFTFSKFRQNVVCYFLETLVKKEVLSLVDQTQFIDLERLRCLADACVYQDLESLFKNLVLVNKRKFDVMNEDLLVKTVYWANVDFLNVFTGEYLSRNDVTPILQIKCDQLDKQDGGSHENDESSDSFNSENTKIDETYITLLHIAMRKADFKTVSYLITKHFRSSVNDNDNGLYNSLIRWLLKNSFSSKYWVVTEQMQIIKYLATLNRKLLFLEDAEGFFPFEVAEPHHVLVSEMFKLERTFYSKINVVIKLVQIMSKYFTYENFYSFIKKVFSELEKAKIEKVICTGKLLEYACYVEGLTIDIFNYFQDKCPSFCNVNSDEKISIFRIALNENHEVNILEWLLINLSYTSEDVKNLLSSCLENFRVNGINTLSVFITRQNDLKSLPNFYEMYEFLFSDAKLLSHVDFFTIVYLVYYFLWKTTEKSDKKHDFEGALTHLITNGLSYFDKLVLQSFLSTSDGCILKLVWITYVCSNLKKEYFVRRFKFFTRDFDIQTRDCSGDTLLHIFAQNFDFDGWKRRQELFFSEIQYSKSIRKISDRKDEYRTLQDILEVLLENNLNILQLNHEKQTPICLLKYTKQNFNLMNDFISTFEPNLCAVNIITAKETWNIDDMHQIFYLVVKSHVISVVKEVYEWYVKVCESHNLNLLKVEVTLDGEKVNFLDAAIQSGDSNVAYFVINVLKIRMPLLRPSPTCIHQFIKKHTTFKRKKTANCIEYLGKTFPELIEQLVNQRNEKNLVPLSLPKVTSDIANVLHSLGANVNSADDYGNTPLHFALVQEKFNLDLVNTLIKCGSDVNAQNLKMETPLFILVDSINLGSISKLFYMDDYIDCFILLIENKADPNTQDDKGNTIIHNLVQKVVSGNVFQRIVEVLISNKLTSVLTVWNVDGITPLQLADKYFHVLEHTRQLLTEHDIFDT